MQIINCLLFQFSREIFKAYIVYFYIDPVNLPDFKIIRIEIDETKHCFLNERKPGTTLIYFSKNTHLISANYNLYKRYFEQNDMWTYLNYNNI